MREFSQIQDSFTIKGRGTMFTSSEFKLEDGEYDPDLFRGETVLLNGVEVGVIGVETFCIPRSPSSPYPYTFGILISDEDAEKVQWKS